MSNPQTPLAPADLARAVVEAFLRRPLSLVVAQRSVLFVDETGVLPLPLRPVAQIRSVRRLDGYPLTTAIVIGDAIHGLPAFCWVETIYDHGWADGELPSPIGAVLAQVQSRIEANPDGVSSESIGGYRVSYGSGADGLSPSERLMLRPYAITRPAGTLDLTAPHASRSMGVDD